MGRRAHLADMAGKSLDLCVNRITNVDVIVSVVRREQQHFSDFVWLQPLIEMLGIGEMVAREGIDGVEGHLADNPVIAMIVALAVRLESDNRIGPQLANQPDYLAAQRLRVLQIPVVMP